ncbi:hypothetical protein [Bradyrhizobium niftali]|uniref:Integrase n=1 Tax=Bradyrhizobium niftali TaxID=2560055 RepID=A0A4Y9LYR1_9BRAD|nr:hypothetical protein [Bradyrhizobium niftali]TFV48052.1 hypothetical protein E4K65_14645 [Bradyrhizobium niftali]
MSERRRIGTDQTAPRSPQDLRDLLVEARHLQAYEMKRSVDHVLRVAEVCELERIGQRMRKRAGGEGRRRPNGASEATRQAYLARGSQMMARYRREAEIGPAGDLDALDAVAWLFAHKPVIKDATWRGYKIDIRSWLEHHRPHGFAEAIDRLASEPQLGRHGKQRPCRLPPERLDVLTRRLTDIGTDEASWLKSWLIAGVTTGLSPVEWRMATLARRGSEIWLDVNMVNARGVPIVCRSLGIGGLNAETRRTIVHMVERCSDVGKPGTWHTRQSGLAGLLREVCRQFDPAERRDYTLHSLRDQFIANMLAVAPPENVAALVGEVVSTEQRRGYGRGRLAWSQSDIVDVPRVDKKLLLHMKRRLNWCERRKDIEYRSGRRKLARTGLAEGVGDKMPPDDRD